MSFTEFTKLKVLLVEDESYTRQIVRNLLRQLGIRSIAEAANGKEGLLELLRTRPDIVFCDIHMTPISGLELLKQVRAVKIADLAATPVVMLTADAGNEAVFSAKELQASGYLVKPVSLNALKARIEAVMAAAPQLVERIAQRI
ncbi:MAG: response regulator [Rhodospirillaceae bacterium]